MNDATATPAKKAAQKTDSSAKNSNSTKVSETALDRCYGQIGISAVAAAVRYQGTTKNPAYAPVATHWNDWADEAA
ncbi:MAG: hypothetical protein ACRECV_13210 [Xanthobacteraceae bacterium]